MMTDPEEWLRGGWEGGVGWDVGGGGDDTLYSLFVVSR